MCNLYRIKERNLATLFDARPLTEPLLFDEELYPKRLAPVIRRLDGERVIDVMRWGFPPPAAGRAPVTNVRNLASPFWRSALNNNERRCLVPVSEFCEWEGEAGAKVKRWFSLPSSPVFAFAGIWRPVGPSAEDERAFAFLTCGYLGDPSQHIVGAIHPKACPVILHPEDYERWLEGEVDDVCTLAEPFPSQLMTVA